MLRITGVKSRQAIEAPMIQTKRGKEDIAYDNDRRTRLVSGNDAEYQMTGYAPSLSAGKAAP